MIDKDAIRPRWDAVGSKPDERGQRLFAAVAAQAERAGFANLRAWIEHITEPGIDYAR